MIVQYLVLIISGMHNELTSIVTQVDYESSDTELLELLYRSLSVGLKLVEIAFKGSNKHLFRSNIAYSYPALQFKVGTHNTSLIPRQDIRLYDTGATSGLWQVGNKLTRESNSISRSFVDNHCLGKLTFRLLYGRRRT